MKNFIITLLLGLLFLPACVPANEPTSVMDIEQPGAVVSTVDEAELSPLSYELAGDVLPISQPLFEPGCIHAGFGLTIDTGETVNDEIAPDDTGGTSPIDWVMNHWATIIAFLFALSEILALIPGIRENGIFQAIYTWLKKKKKAGA